MDKVTDFLERHVQWVALGLGALWLLLMAWWYVITPPAAVEVGGRTLTAGEVDPNTATTVKEQLEVAINEATVPEMRVTPFAETFLAKMSWQNAPAIVLATGFTNFQPSSIPMPPETQPGGQQGAVAGTNTVPGGNVNINPVEGLPAVPQPIPSDSRVGRSAIQPVVQQGVPGQPMPPPRPMAQQALQPELEQKDWVTQAFTISIAELAQAFQAAQIPPQFSRTAFLQVDLVREEQLPDGTWGNEKLIPKLNLGVQNPEFPRGKAPRAVEMGYLNWATSNQAQVLQPGFFTVVQGEQWLPPGEDMLVQNVAFQPQQYPAGTDISKLTEEQKKQVMQWRREQYKLQQEQKRQAAPRGGRRDGEMSPDEMMGMEGMYPAPRDADRRAFAQAQRRPQPRRNIPPAIPPEMMGLTPEEMMGMMPEDMMGMDGMGMQPQQPGVRAGVPGVDYPQGEFDPSQWVGNEPIKVFAHDDTVEPGKTYRYKIRYHIKNPLYNTGNVAKNPAHAQQLALESKDSNWAAPVTIPGKVQFFIAGGVLGGRVNFDVFTWKDGVVQNKTFVATPGDPVGRPDADMDYTTGWTLVTLPAQQGDDRIVLVNNEGQLQARTSRADQGDPLYKKLKEAAKLAAEQAGVAAANGVR